MSREIEKMFGLMEINLNEDKSNNQASKELFENVMPRESPGYEETFPVTGFRVDSISTFSTLEISNVEIEEWEDESVFIRCDATWEIDVDPEDWEAWGAVFQELWYRSAIFLTHDDHPGLFFTGVFPEVLEYGAN
jgi:hypothetical protein